MTRDRRRGSMAMLRVIGLLAGLILFSTNGYGDTGFYGTALDKASGDIAFRMTDLDGKIRTPADFKGKVVLLFFGFLRCPDACPDMAYKLSRAKALLGADEPRVQIAFATLDPDQDSSEAIRSWLKLFDESSVGFRDTDEELRRETGKLKLYFRRVALKEAGSYTIEHGSQAYVYDPKGRLRLLIRPEVAPSRIASDIRVLLHER
ncbi:SCO family protein (plasmid) [Burkholderia ambifaria]|uniref:SCO family protein n=1 Tax=Burkholderia ambifaria TaxID=152480 RepID=UPI001E45784D|nr:SCO family protein [Burkholderia ambifaria]UEP39794.1 SCO family protein [Burkholderia ambifaria]